MSSTAIKAASTPRYEFSGPDWGSPACFSAGHWAHMMNMKPLKSYIRMFSSQIKSSSTNQSHMQDSSSVRSLCYSCTNFHFLLHSCMLISSSFFEWIQKGQFSDRFILKKYSFMIIIIIIILWGFSSVEQNFGLVSAKVLRYAVLIVKKICYG